MQSQFRRILLLVVVALAGFMVARIAIPLFIEDPSSSGPTPYAPKFTHAQAELVLGRQAPAGTLYVRTTELESSGHASAHISIYRIAGSDWNEQHRPTSFRAIAMDNTVHAVGKDYIAFRIPATNPDCLAVYMNDTWVPHQTINLNALPIPSDAWMCKGYDFVTAPQP